MKRKKHFITLGFLNFVVVYTLCSFYCDLSDTCYFPALSTSIGLLKYAFYHRYIQACQPHDLPA